MIINLDYFLVTVDQKYESEITPSGIITTNAAFVDVNYKETDDRYRYKRIFGRVEACPRGFSNTTHSLVDPGIPAPTKYMSHDMICQRIRMGHREMSRRNYNPSSFDDFEKITLADIGRKTDIRRFDKIYFDYRVTEPDNLVGSHDGKELYKVRVDQILCSVRDGQIITQGGWCLVEPNMETWDEITTPSGIIMKPQPQAKYLEGVVRHIADGGIKPGDKILYEKNADWTVKVEGVDYYSIEEMDILGKFV
jgi:co-chaperonin GroES (HSP10)